MRSIWFVFPCVVVTIPLGGDLSAQTRQADAPLVADASGNEAAVSSLIVRLSDADPNIRASAVKQLGDLGTKALPAVPPLLRIRSDSPEPGAKLQ
ncbi:MAG: hypothetical protein GXY83_34600 [Rhodopirellula sp.]|nr:hypothetical protein [Rhodopirellula sp.]